MRNVWLYPEEFWVDTEHRFSKEKHGPLKDRITTALRTRMDQSY